MKVREIWEKGKSAYAVLAENRYTTVAGTLVFFLIMSLVPFLFWLTLLFGNTLFRTEVIEGLQLFDWAEELILLFGKNAQEAGTGAGVVFLATTLFSSTGFFYHLRRSGEMIYGCRRAKHGLKVRIAAVLATFAVLLFFAAAGSALLVAGIAARFLPEWVSYPFRYGLLLALGFFAAWILNGYLCPYRVRPPALALGSFFTALLWLAASAAFSVYLGFGGKEKLYGALTLVVVFLLWLYWLMICFVAGVIYNRQRMQKDKLAHKRF